MKTEIIKAKTNCSHFQCWVNQCTWACDLKDENGNQIHPECICENCPDSDSHYEDVTISYTEAPANESNIQYSTN